MREPDQTVRNSRLRCIIFLGSNLSRKALENGDELIVFDNKIRVGSEENLRWLHSIGNFLFIQGDIRNKNDIEPVIKKYKPDTVFHTAGQVAMTTSIQNPLLDFETNAIGTMNLLESIRNFSDKSLIIYSSTNKVYGDLNQFSYEETETRYICKEHPSGFPENVPLDFRTPYGISKGTADQYMLEYSRTFGLRTVVFRHSSIFGTRQFATVDQGWVGWFTLKALETLNHDHQLNFQFSGNGKQVRDLLFVDDAVDLYYKAVTQIDKISGRVFNIGGGIDNSLSLLELFDLLKKQLNLEAKYVHLPPRQSDQKVFVADISAIKNAIDWGPQVGKEQGIRKVIKWLVENKFEEIK